MSFRPFVTYSHLLLHRQSPYTAIGCIINNKSLLDHSQNPLQLKDPVNLKGSPFMRVTKAILFYTYISIPIMSSIWISQYTPQLTKGVLQINAKMKREERKTYKDLKVEQFRSDVHVMVYDFGKKNLKTKN